MTARNDLALAARSGGVGASLLIGVAATGRLDGVLFELTLRQTYRNAGEQPLEVLYTFPLPHDAVLLGFAATLNGDRKEGVIVPKRQAEREYEAALAEGDAPVMLEVAANGLHTANLGNLKPGDEMVLEVRFAQILCFEQGRLRLAIPTTIAPRYGRAETDGLQPHQTPRSCIGVEHPLALSITLGPALAGAQVHCPSHRHSVTASEQGMCLQLDAGASLDRDVVVLVTPREAQPGLVVQARDGISEEAPIVAMAALQPPPAALRESLAIKVLVDCSGSMAGDSIASARSALHGLLRELTPADHVSLTRFGSRVEHALPCAPCSTTASLEAHALIEEIDADLGGTEMQQALASVFALRTSHRVDGADVLLLTDGEVWNTQPIIDAARASKHRVFVIGVGSSPAEPVLRSLAEATGGYCEFATPGEAMEAAARRMLARMRQRPWSGIRIDWGEPTVWEVRVPAGVFSGDTVVAFAGLEAGAAVHSVRLLASGDMGEAMELARGEADAPCPGEALSRVAAARRLPHAAGAEAMALALAYQLMTGETHCILVHRRADADKVTDEAEIRQVESMLAAGWGGTSTVHLESHDARFSIVAAPAIWRTTDGVREFEPVRHSRRQSLDWSDDGAEIGDGLAPLMAIADTVVEHLSSGRRLEELPARCQRFADDPRVKESIDQVVDLGLSEPQAWMVLAAWIAKRIRGEVADASDALRVHLQRLERRLVDDAFRAFAAAFGIDGSETPTETRADRWRRWLAAR